MKTNIAAFLAPAAGDCSHALLFFSGATQRPETADGRRQQANAPRQQPDGRSPLDRRFGRAGKDPLAERSRRLADNAGVRVRVAVAVELARGMRFRSVVRLADAHASLVFTRAAALVRLTSNSCRSTSLAKPQAGSGASGEKHPARRTGHLPYIMTENRPFG